jgi:hypothetical protein
MPFSTIRKYVQQHFPQTIWLVLLLLLFFMDTTKEAFSFCLFRLIGFSSCPGCGIGHSIHFALHFQFREAWLAHPFGIPATIGILCHIINSFYQTQKRYRLLWTNNKC